MGMQYLATDTSRSARALDAAHLCRVEGFKPSNPTEGQLPRQLEPPR